MCYLFFPLFNVDTVFILQQKVKEFTYKEKVSSKENSY